jgi:hypothetical protein
MFKEYPKKGKNLIQQTYGRQDESHGVCFLKEKIVRATDLNLAAEQCKQNNY